MRPIIDPVVRGTAPELVPSVHRIIAESLTNVGRHVRGVSDIEVAVRLRTDRLVVVVQYDGEDALPPDLDSFGLVGMRERTASLGGLPGRRAGAGEAAGQDASSTVEIA